MRIIVGCEFSQVVTKAFRANGQEAYSCDIIPCEGGHPEWHFQEDVLKVLKIEKFDLGIFHPPCTHLAVSGARWFKEKQAEQAAALEFVRKLMVANIEMICIENPISIISSKIRKPDQIIQPWMFGHGETKATCLWLKNLQPLSPTNIVEGREAKVHKMPPGPERWKLRSTTYTGIAEAMAEQWGICIETNKTPEVKHA
jgi:site-specific DNA-cytosine methylase